MDKIHLLLVVLTCIETVVCIILPTVYWDPSNPLFHCDTTINVRLDDVINFVCPDGRVPYVRSDAEEYKTIYENAYLIGDNALQYKTCNSLGGLKMFSCDNPSAKFRMHISANPATYGSLIFHPGITYHLIGTGFRTKENIHKRIGGSCNHVGRDEKGSRFKLRLKIYVCSVFDIYYGFCRSCNDASCYYKDCFSDRECTFSTLTDHLIHHSANGSCSYPKVETCRNKHLNTVISRISKYIAAPCPTKPAPPAVLKCESEALTKDSDGNGMKIHTSIQVTKNRSHGKNNKDQNN